MSRTALLLLVIHAASTLLMTGVIWFVQVVHYPLFRAIPPASFPAYEASHTVRTGWLVAPLMLVELASGLALAAMVLRSSHASWQSVEYLCAANAALLVAIWLITFSVQVPHHQALQAAFDPLRIESLVSGNWARTALWSIRTLFLLKLLWDRLARAGI